jgi:hypothetical protein
MQSHRDWLLGLHGPVCAYCGTETSDEVITLDHVRPRRGQTAYDRPDNLVLACRDCNAAKADTPLVAFLMQRRSRGSSSCTMESTSPSPLGSWPSRHRNGRWRTRNNADKKGGPDRPPFDFSGLRFSRLLDGFLWSPRLG